MEWYIIFYAFVLDLLAGDPAFLPHPVIYMGKAVDFFEPKFRKILYNQIYCGVLFAVFLIGSTFIITRLILYLCAMINDTFSVFASILLLFFTFSTKSLYKAAIDVKKALEENGIEAGREKVAMIVGRETDRLDEKGVVKASVETVAENFVDGFLSPLFFALIGGVPCAMAYKMVNTLDSMVGYKNDKYIEFGKAAAKIDDAANYIPARLSVILIFLSASLMPGKRGLSSLKTGFKEGKLHKSPNAGYPEAAFSGALRVKLGGPNYYHGTLVEKPYIGKWFQDPGLIHIKRACDLMLAASFISVVISCSIAFIAF